MKRWKDNWDAVSPIFKFSATVRKVIYTTNAIEITEFHLSEAQPVEKCISKRYRPVKSPVSGHFWGYEKMDCYDPKLDTGLRRTKHYVRRTFTWIIGRPVKKTGVNCTPFVRQYGILLGNGVFCYAKRSTKQTIYTGIQKTGDWNHAGREIELQRNLS